MRSQAPSTYPEARTRLHYTTPEESTPLATPRPTQCALQRHRVVTQLRTMPCSQPVYALPDPMEAAIYNPRPTPDPYVSLVR
jgi:hypothetical protein